ncbi:MAG: tetratricopeptide repeat protein [Verrucomicrobiota bacterium]
MRVRKPKRPEPAPAPPPAADHSLRLVYLGLALITLLLYLPVREHEFLNYDDDPYVTENPQVRQGLTWANIVWAFTDMHFYMWHPLTSISHMLDVELFGLNPGAHHVMNVLLHTLSTLLVFALLFRTTKTLWPSIFVAALFAWHPLRVESVAWIAERKDVMSGLFWLLTLHAYVRYVEQPGPRRLWTAVGVYGLAILTKPMVVTLPCALLLLDVWPLRRLKLDNLRNDLKAAWPLVREKVPFFALSVLLAALTFYAQKSGDVVQTFDRFSFAARLSNALVSYARYLGKAIWPADLAVFYPHPGTWPLWQTLGAVMLLVAVTWLVWRYRSARPYLFTGWFWYLGTLVPVIGLVQVGGQSMADRYTYVPLIGIAVMVVWGLAELRQRMPRWSAPVLGVAVIASLACLVATRLQLRHWKNSETLFRHTLSVTGQDTVPRVNLAETLVRQNRPDEAVEVLRAGLKAEPDDANSWNALGMAFAAKGEYEEALKAYQEAMRLDSGLHDVKNNLGNALIKLGRPAEALRIFEELAAQEKPDADLLNNWGLALSDVGRRDEAIAKYREALKLNPFSPLAHQNLGLTLMEVGQIEQAIEHHREAARLKPGFFQAHAAMGFALATLKRHAEAAEQYREALRFNPQFTEAHAGLGLSLGAMGDLKSALHHLGEAAKLEPTNPQKHFLLASAANRAGDVTTSTKHYREAARLAPNDANLLWQVAWLLATHPSPEFRNGEEAVKLATRACELTQQRDALPLDSLAAAYAETGRFGEAAATATKALEAARQQQLPMAAAIEQRLRLYQEGKPWRETR